MGKDSSGSDVSLASFLKDLGYGSTFSSTVIAAVLEQVGIHPSNGPQRITESVVARLLAMNAVTHTGLKENPTLVPLCQDLLSEAELKQMHSMTSWNTELLFPFLMKLNPSMSWSNILRSLDHPDTSFPDANSLAVVLKASKAVLKDIYSFPIGLFMERWTNTRAQLSFLRHTIQVAPELFTMNHTIVRRVVPLDTAIAGNVGRSILNAAAISPWNSIELIQCVLELCESPLAAEATALLDLGVQQSPDFIVLAMAQLALSWGSIAKELAPDLVLLFLSGQPHSPYVLPYVWQFSPGLFISGLILMYSKDPLSLSRILDIAQEMKALAQILESKPFSFTIDLAALAYRREYLNLEKWLQDHIAEEGESFIHASLDFLNGKVNEQVGRSESIKQSVPLSVDAVGIFLRVIQANSSSLSPENTKIFKDLVALCSQIYSRNGNPATEGEMESASFAPDIEDEANTLYEKIYKGDLPINQVIELLQRLKASDFPRDQETFKCMIHNLFDEYKFFPRYPEKELAITSFLFGALIQNQVVTSMSLGMALRYVLEALRQPVGSKLFKFGLQALLQFQSRLAEWPQYCGLLIQIEHLNTSHPEVVQAIKNIQKQIQIASGKDGAKVGSSAEEDAVFKSVSIEQLPGDFKQETPPESVQDKILFTVNNVSFDNIESKFKELGEQLIEPYYPWFSHYLVVKRVSIEPNFHSLYIGLLDMLNLPQLNKHILRETLRNISVLLNSEKTVSSSQERSLLKNLGAWLGGITLAKNKPIKHKHLAFKELLVEGYMLNRLIVVIPFVCKVLEQTTSSKVFRQHNPWLVCMMRLLAELYHFAELKLNLKFEIEVLCKNIKMDIKDIQPSEYLRLEIQRLAAQEMKKDSLNSQSRVYDYGETVQMQGGAADSGEDGDVGYPNLALFITFNPNITLFTTQPSLKRIVHIAIDRSIREVILSPVVERSVTISVVATREIVTKDFALESNEEKMRKAAHFMAQSLAGSLASVSSREPLRVSMISNLRSLLMQNGFTEQTVPEQVLFVIVSDNLDLACSVMEKAAAEKAIPEIDESLAAAYMNRRKHIERTGQPYFDMAIYSASRYPSILPEILRLRPSGLSAQQLHVYEDFLRLPMIHSANQTRNERADMAGAMSMEESLVTAQQLIDNFTAIVNELDKHLNETPNLTLAMLPSNQEIRSLMEQLPLLLSQSPSLEEFSLVFSQKIVQLIYKNTSDVVRSAYVLILKKFCEMSKPLLKEIREWFLYNEDERKYDVMVTIALLESDLISIADLDMQLARLIETGRPSILAFAQSLLKVCLFERKDFAFYTDFLYCIQSLERVVAREEDTASIVDLLDSINKSSSIVLIQEAFSDTAEPDTLVLREQLTLVFQDWVHIYYHPSSNEQSHMKFVTNLQNILKFDTISPLFFRVCAEVSVESFRIIKASATPSRAFQAVDAFARLIVLLIAHHKDPSGVNDNHARLNLTAKILSIVVLVLVHFHEQNQSRFNQKPFFRLFSSLLNDLKTLEHHFQPVYIQILSAVSNTLHTLQPSFLPGFTFAWIQLISHRNFMPKLLLSENQKFWPFFQRLLVDLFKVLSPLLRSKKMPDSAREMYKAALRILLVLLHDFPEFLCDYHFSLVDVIPYSCIQLRNLILGAFPRNMRLPDPFTPNLKVDLLPEINQSPRILSDYTNSLLAGNFKHDVDTYLKTRGPVSFLMDLRSRLLLDKAASQVMDESKYNIPMINSLVMYVGVQAIAQSQQKQLQGVSTITQSAPMDIFQQLVVDLDTEGRYLFLTAIANQLRYPNSHTHYFSCVLLYLFAEASQEIIQEQITRVLIERLIVNRPHPYGMLITFIELIRNPRYNFWDHTGFINSSPEIERLFQNVAKSIMTQS